MAKRIYADIIYSALSLVEEYKENIDLIDNQEKPIAFENLRNTLHQLSKVSNDPNKPRWMHNILARKGMRHFEEVDQQHCERNKENLELRQRVIQHKKQSQTLAERIETKDRTIEVLTNNIQSIQPIIELRKPHQLVSTELEQYISEKEISNEWNGRSLSQNSANLKRFTEIIGTELSVSDLNGDVIRHYQSILQRLPRNAGRILANLSNQSAVEKKQAWTKLADENSGACLIPSKHLTVVATFLKWLYKQGSLDKDLSVFIKHVKKNRDSVQRGQYEPEQLADIFNSYIYSDYLRPRESSPKSYHFWAPIIALTTGMRISEIAALEVEDIVVHKEIRCFDLNEKWKSKALKESNLSKSKKNKSSVRIIPIPDVLWAAGLKFLIGKRKSGLLFPDLTLSKSKGLGNEISKWFNESFCEYGKLSKYNSKGHKLVFHSFRHTFISCLNETVLSIGKIDKTDAFALTGHTSSEVRDTVYTHSVSMEYCKTFMDAMDFGIDLSQLSYEKFLNRIRPLKSVRNAKA